MRQVHEQAIVKLRECGWTFTKIATHLGLDRGVVIRAHHRLVPLARMKKIELPPGMTHDMLRWNKHRKRVGLPLFPKGHTRDRYLQQIESGTRPSYSKPQQVCVVRLTTPAEDDYLAGRVPAPRFYHSSFEL